MKHVQAKVRRWQLAAAIALAIGGGGCLVAYLSAQTSFCSAYLTAFLFWWQTSIGFLSLALLRCVVRSHWGNSVWPYLKASLWTLPVIAAAFVPVALLRDSIFPWAAAETHDHQPLNPFQQRYFEDSFFLWRSVAYFAIWIVCGLIAGRTGLSSGEARLPRRIASLSIAAVVLTSSFAAMDWGMSLEPAWYSTIYGGLVLVSGVVGAMAVLILSVAGMFRLPRLEGVRVRQVVNDLGNLELAFLMVWAYFAFSQYLIIWSGNLPSEVTWYVRRSAGSWQAVMLAVVALHFVIPFALLLSRDQKRRPRRLARVAGLLLAGNLLQTIWTYAPSTAASVGDVPWSLAPAVLAIGGLWLLAYSIALKVALGQENLTGVGP